MASDEASEAFDDLIVAQKRQKLETVLEPDIVREGGSESYDEEQDGQEDLEHHEIDGDEVTPSKMPRLANPAPSTLPRNGSEQSSSSKGPVVANPIPPKLSPNTLAAHDRANPPANLLEGLSEISHAQLIDTHWGMPMRCGRQKIK